MGDNIYTFSEPNAAAKGAELPAPKYPPAARAAKVGGSVKIQVLINEIGRVVFAKGIGGGHQLLQASAVEAVRAAKFKPPTLKGLPVKVSGIVVYNFVP